MKVIHIRSSTGFFGAESVLVTLLPRLNDTGIVNKLILLKSSDVNPPELYIKAKAVGVDSEIVDCSGRVDFKAVRRIKQLIESEGGVDIVHSHDVKSDMYAYLAARKTGVRLAATLHGWTSDTFAMRVYEWVDRQLLKKFSGIASVSDSIYKKVKRTLRKKITVIPNGVDTEKYNLEKEGFGKSYWGVPADHYVYGIVARLTKEKGHSVLFKSFADVCRKTADATLLVIGDGPEQKNLKSLAKNLGIAPKVVFAGACNQIDKALHDIDCYVSASHTEGMPMIILEVMASGIPIVATAVGSIPTLLESGAGCVIPPNNAQAMAQALISARRNNAEALKAAKIGVDRVRQKYDAVAQAWNYQDFYKNLLGTKQCLSD